MRGYIMRAEGRSSGTTCVRGGTGLLAAESVGIVLSGLAAKVASASLFRAKSSVGPAMQEKKMTSEISSRVGGVPESFC